ncbi:hypothetical protein GA0111570_10150 [Raineyella antarctica]|uniref:DUF2304 domain-containing protein n=1 Tax=Raineyella antarctica TaxID=1577474 RepID=A0A1G6GCS1_9ACTN|nr:DUF2304 domain-containing protein [Raineyella antarctica]SDB79781.1 hypothetical protein GA0111570_10150 [Raineyella antarctica]
MLIQVILIVLALLLVYLILASRGSHGAKASMKLGLILLAIAMIIAVLRPQLMSQLASFLGVGRGTDLLLYAVTGAFLFYALTQYLKSQSQRDVIFRLARRVALIEADNRYGSILTGPLDAPDPQTPRPLTTDADDRTAGPVELGQPYVDPHTGRTPQD